MKPIELAFLKTSVPLFADLPEERINNLANAFRVAVFAPGDLVAHAGDEVHSLTVILEGRIVASVEAPDGGRENLGHLGPGETFGEMALMTGDPIVADLSAEI